MAINIRLQSQADNSGIMDFARMMDSSIQYAANKAISSIDAAALRIESSINRATQHAATSFATMTSQVIQQMNVLEVAIDRVASKAAGLGGGAGPNGGPNASKLAAAQATIQGMLSGFETSGAYRMTVSPSGQTTKNQYYDPGTGVKAWVNSDFSKASFSQGAVDLNAENARKKFDADQKRQRIFEAARYYQGQWDSAQGSADHYLSRYQQFQSERGAGILERANDWANVLQNQAAGRENQARMMRMSQMNRAQQMYDSAYAASNTRGGIRDFQGLVDQYGMTPGNTRQRRNAAGSLEETVSYSGNNRTLLDRVLRRNYTQYSGELNKTTGAYSFDTMEKEAGRATRAIGTLKDSMVSLAASLFTLRTAGSILKSIFVDPITNFKDRIIDSTEEYRKFELAISGVAGGTGRAREIDKELLKQSRNLPLSVQELHDAGIGLTYTQYGASRVAAGTPKQAAGAMVDYGTLLSQLQFLAPEQGITGAAIAVREALAGNFQSARRRLNTSPELIAGSLSKPGGGRYSLQEITGNQDLTMQAFSKFADTWIGREPIEGRFGILSEVQKKVSDAITQIAAKVGDSGLYDKIVDRFRSMMDQLFKFLDDPKFTAIAQKVSDTMVRAFDILGNSILSFVERLTGTNDVQSSLLRLSDMLANTFTKIVSIGEYLPKIVGWLGDVVGVLINKAGSAAAGSLHQNAPILAAAMGIKAPSNFAAEQQAKYEADQKFPPGTKMNLGLTQQHQFDRDYVQFYQKRLGELSSGGFGGGLPDMPTLGGGGTTMASMSSGRSMERSIQDMIIGNRQSGNIRPLLTSFLSSIQNGAQLFQAMGGSGSEFEFSSSPFSRGLINAAGIPGKISTSLSLDRGVEGSQNLNYQQILDRVNADLSSLHGIQSSYSGAAKAGGGVVARMGSRMSLMLGSGLSQTMGGFADMMSSDTFRDSLAKNEKDLLGKRDAVMQLPGAAGSQLVNVAGSLAQSLDSVAPQARSAVLARIMKGAFGLADQVADALQLPAGARAELKAAYDKGMKENAAYFLEKQYHADIDKIGFEGQYGTFNSRGRTSAALTPREAAERRMNTNRIYSGKFADQMREEMNTDRFRKGDTTQYDNLAAQAAMADQEVLKLKHDLNDTLLAVEEFSARGRSAIEGGIGDALYSLVTASGDVGDAFKSMGQSILKAFTDMEGKIVTQFLMGDFGKPNAGAGGVGMGGIGGLLGGIAGLFGGGTQAAANGGIFPGSFMPIQAFSNGGVAHRPTIGIIAEAGMSEAMVPLPDGKSIPVRMTGGSGSGGRTYIIANDEADAARKGYRPGRDDIVHLKNAVAADIANGGVVGQAIRKKTGR